MKIIEFFKTLFKTPEFIVEDKRTLKDLTIGDTVWVKDNGEIFEGWIYDITRRCIVVVYDSLKDYRFRIIKPLTLTEIVQGDKTLYCNEPTDETYTRITWE